MGRGGVFRRRGTAGRVTGAVQAPVLVPEAVEEGRSLFDLSASARPVPEEFADSVSCSWRSLLLVFSDAGLVQSDGADGDGLLLLVGH